MSYIYNLRESGYQILNSSGRPVTYVIDVQDPQDAVCALMLVLAIDAEKCSRSD